jgi:hypothetical protein
VVRSQVLAVIGFQADWGEVSLPDLPRGYCVACLHRNWEGVFLIHHMHEQPLINTATAEKPHPDNPTQTAVQQQKVQSVSYCGKAH